MKAYLIKKDKATVIELPKDPEKSLDFFYEQLEVDLIEFAYAKIGKKTFAIICDEEGLYKGELILSATNWSGNLNIFGNIIVIPPETDDEGNIKRGLDQEEIELLKNRTKEEINHLFNKVIFFDNF